MIYSIIYTNVIVND